MAVAVGTALPGSLVAGWLANSYGRRAAIVAACIAFIGGSTLQALASSIGVLIAGRALVGVGVGATAAVTPLYLAEIAPPATRGAVVTTNSIAITGGQLIATVVDAALADVPSGWRWMLGLGAVPAAVQLLGLALLGLPESPTWLRLRGRDKDADDALRWFLGDSIGAAPLPPPMAASNAIGGCKPQGPAVVVATVSMARVRANPKEGQVSDGVGMDLGNGPGGSLQMTGPQAGAGAGAGSHPQNEREVEERERQWSAASTASGASHGAAPSGDSNTPLLTGAAAPDDGEQEQEDDD